MYTGYHCLMTHNCLSTAVSFLKRAWHELPDIVAGTALAIFSAIGCVGVYFYKKSTGDLDIKRYRMEYTGKLYVHYLIMCGRQSDIQ